MKGNAKYSGFMYLWLAAALAEKNGYNMKKHLNKYGIMDFMGLCLGSLPFVYPLHSPLPQFCGL